MESNFSIQDWNKKHLKTLIKEDQDLSGERDDLFWDTASSAGLEPAIVALKQAGFSIEDVCGFIESHWNRF
jgi:hypothetical protein